MVNYEIPELGRLGDDLVMFNGTYLFFTDECNRPFLDASSEPPSICGMAMAIKLR